MTLALSVVVPAFDEAAHVREHVARIARAIERFEPSFEVLVVDDGSRDATAAEARRAAEADARVRVLAHARNRGKGAALATGCAEARGDVLVFLDADLEISPAEVEPLLARMRREGAGVAVASKWLPGASQERPLARVALSRVYLAVTALLFRLPIRDTQTGLKAVRRDLARAIVPAIRAQRYAWDVELLLLAHRAGARIAQVPVAVSFLARGTRIGWRGFLRSGFDTFATFVRDRGLGAYGAAVAAARGRPRLRPRATRVVVSGDDLGLSPSVDRGIVDALARGQLTSASLLVDGRTAASAAADVAARAPHADLGVHVDLARGRLVRYLVRGTLGLVPARATREEVRRQVAAARALGVQPTHVDAHRHAFLPRGVYRAVAAEAKALGLVGVRFPAPAGAMRAGPGPSGVAKALVLFAAGIGLRGLPAAAGLAAPAGLCDAAVASEWGRRGRLPRAVRGRCVEIVAHPARGGDDVPAHESGLDRAADARRLEGLLDALARAGARATTFAEIAGRPPAAARVA